MKKLTVTSSLPRVLTLVVLAVAGYAFTFGHLGGAVTSAQSGSAGRVLPQHMVYEGAFRLPNSSGPGGETGDANSFNGGGEALTFNPETGALMLTGSRCCNPTTVAEINIPEVRNVSTISQLATATYRQAHTDVLQGHQRDVGCGGPVGGLLPWAGRLIASVYCYYDAGYVQNRSHFVTGLNFTSLPAVTGPIEVQSPATGGGRAGFVSGYMGTIPAEWQAAFGGNALVGNCCIPIITRTSWGPAISVVDANDFGRVDPVPATNVLSYPTGHPLDGDAACEATSTLFNCNTAISSVIFVPGTSTVLFFGTQGTGEACYGFGTSDPALHHQQVPTEPAGNQYCYDPAAGSKGGHAYPYQHHIWAYDANDLVAVKNGQRQPWEVRPYAVWGYETPFQVVRRGIGGAAYDPATRRLYISASEQDAPRPLIQVFRINLGATAPSDTTPPTVTMAAPGAGATVSGSLAFGATASDNVGVAGVWFTVDGGTVGSEDPAAPYSTNWNSASVPNGTHTLRAVARDAAGNVATSAPVTITVSNGAAPGDTTAPTVSVSAPTEGATVSGVAAVSASASDNVGVTSVQFTLNGVNLGAADTVAPYTINWSTTGAANGSHVLRAVARDAAGNSTTSAARSVTVNNASADGTAPAVSMDAPGEGATVSGVAAVSASASDNVGVTSVQFTLNGVNLGAADTSAPYTISWSTTGAVNGSHVLRAIARDAAGNSTTSAARTVTVNNTTAPPPPSTDTTLPTVSLTAPGAWSTQSRTITVGANASDNVGVVNVQFTVNDQNIGAADTSSPYSTSWNTATVANGTYTLRAVARDSAGNVRTSATRTVFVNNTAEDRALAAGAARADLNGDRRPDLLFQNTNGQMHGWFMDGTRMVGNNSLTPGAVNPVWEAVSLDDFNSDGKNDVLWQHNTTGQTHLWFLDGVTMTSERSIGPSSSTWKVSATGDFNNDGQTDIVWQQPGTGSAKVWLMNGTTLTVEAGLGSSGASVSWRIGGAADFNADGRDDLVLQNRATGELFLGYMSADGRNIASTAPFSPAAANPAWLIKTVADFDRDGKNDLVWQHIGTGQLYIWYLDGARMVRGEFLTPGQVNPSWRIVSSK